MSPSTLDQTTYETGSEERQDADWARVCDASIASVARGDREPWVDVVFGQEDDSGTVTDEVGVFLDEVWDVAGRGEEDRAIDVIFRHIDRLLVEGRFAECDRILEEVDIAQTPPVLMISFLTITAAARNRLQSRASFFQAVMDIIVRERGDTAANRLLDGLE